MNHGRSPSTRMLNALRSPWTIPAWASASTPANTVLRNDSGDSRRTSWRRGAGASFPMYRIDRRFSTRRAGVGTGAPPFLACADQAPDLGREARVEDGLRGPAVSGLTQVDRPMIDAPLDARVQGRVIRHLGIVGLFGLYRTAGHMCRDEITRSPARIGKLVGTSSPGTSWSYGPLGAIDPGGMNLWGRISRTVTLKPHRAIGWDEASAVVEITLVGERQAQVGHEFVYRGPQPECRPCKVRAACLNQALGQRYRIKRVRDVTHPCLLNEERARVVEVELAPPEASLPSRAAIEGAVLSYEKIVCSNAACPNFRLCHPLGIEPGMRVRVQGVGAELDCPLGYSLVSATVAYGD